MLLLNIDYIPNAEFEVLGLVDGSVVMSQEPAGDFMAGMRSFVGGEIKEYTQMLSEARQIAVERMMKTAESLHADAIINIRYCTSEVMHSAAEMIAYGTAVKYV